MQIWAVAPVKHIASKFCSGHIDYERQNQKSKSMGGKDENGKKNKQYSEIEI